MNIDIQGPTFSYIKTPDSALQIYRFRNQTQSSIQFAITNSNRQQTEVHGLNMLSLRFVAILAFSAAVSGTNDPVDCEVTTDVRSLNTLCLA